MTYLSQYTLSLAEVRSLRISDSYSAHRMVYGLFDNVRGGNTQEHSGILFADKGGDARRRRWLMLSQRPPNVPLYGELETKELPPNTFTFPAYRFEIVMNPVYRENKSRKLVAVRGREAVAAWFCTKAPEWGFSVREESLLVGDITVDYFKKGEHSVTLCRASLYGFLDVRDNEKFARSVCNGLGRGRAFGCGLLQIVPAL